MLQACCLSVNSQLSNFKRIDNTESSSQGFAKWYLLEGMEAKNARGKRGMLSQFSVDCINIISTLMMQRAHHNQQRYLSLILRTSLCDIGSGDKKDTRLKQNYS